MIYLDNAATSWPKPPAVLAAMRDFAENWAANPDRSCHRMGIESGQRIAQARALLSDLLRAPDASRIVFALNGTDALNIALKGFLNDGDHVVTTSYEHNSVGRPLAGLERAGRISVTRIAPQDDLTLSPDAIRRACTDRTRLVAVTAASNVFGAMNDLPGLALAAHDAGAAILVDAAQAVGFMDIDVAAAALDMVAFPCHKGLYGPMGAGALYVRPGLDLRPLREGGTGTRSESETHPEEMPYRLEAGTPNAHGLAGLAAGLAFLRETGLERVRERERALALAFSERLAGVPGVTIFTGRNQDAQAGIVTLRIHDMASQDVAAAIDSRYGIAVRGGLHCAPGAHRFLGTFPDGAVRVSFGYFNSENDAETAARAISEISRAAL
ncbi:MAG: aminotransferase class V-fold PLP-dependent enzyme [Elusimicrobia bacterium]|nr:aminotransferase class V-fold PLP-dependent enzyme [Elusimicrobiota bacterium]